MTSVLVVDDYKPWHGFISTTLQKRPELQVIGQGFDGFQAVQHAQQLQPDLVLLDIGLPTLNGIEAARRIHEVSAESRILFVSENRSWDIAEEALRTGALGYVVKSDAATDLLPGVEAVLRGERFVSASLAHLAASPAGSARDANRNVVTLTPLSNAQADRHEVAFYSDDRRFLDDATQFIGAALKNGDAAIVVATGSHRDRLLLKLQAFGLDIGASIEQGRYIQLDAADTLSGFMVNGAPDPVQFLRQPHSDSNENCEEAAPSRRDFRRRCASSV